MEPHLWVDLLTIHTAKRDMFSAKSLMTILEGVEQIALARGHPQNPVKITAFHVSLFERLHGSFNNPALLKAVGQLYLNDFPSFRKITTGTIRSVAINSARSRQ